MKYIDIDYEKEAGRYADEYAKLEITGTQYLAFRDIKQLIQKYVKGKETLDYGCGCGKSTMFLKTLGLNVSGVDINKDMIRHAAKEDINGNYAVITSGNISAYDNSYDLVFSSWVMMEISSKSELMKIGQEIYRVLKPNGIFIMIVCNENTYNRDWLTENTEFEENRELSSGSRVKILFKDLNLSIYDYFWSDEDYWTIIRQSNMQLLETHSPLGDVADGYDWRLEKSISPVTIYVAQKLAI